MWGSADGQTRSAGLPYYVFLDVDGVFTNARVHVSAPKHQPVWARFDPVAVDFMNLIAESATDVQFVLSSSWRKGHDAANSMSYHWLVSMFANAGFRGKWAHDWRTDDSPPAALEGETWSFYEDRAHEIRHYLQEHQHRDFLIFDDTDYSFDKVLGKKRFIRCDDQEGLLYKHMQKAKAIVGEWT